MTLPAAGPGEAGEARTINLLFVINSAIVGGAERHTLDLAEGMRAFGWRTTLFAMRRGVIVPADGVDLLQPDGTRSLHERIGDLRATIARLNPALIVSVNERPVLAAWLGRLAANAKVPLVAILHSTVLRNARERMMQVIYNRLFNRAECVVFVSHNQQTYWREHGLVPRRSQVILNGVDVDHFTPAIRETHRSVTRRRLGFSDDDLVLGLCAVMRPEKNHLQLLEVVARLAGQGVPAKALLVGDGPRRSLILERARALGIEDRVVLVGMAQDVRPYVAAFDIGVLCSVSIETLSLAALEIMAMGVPMVMSDISGASEIVDGSNGLLFPVGDDQGFEQAVRSFGDASRREAAGRAARTRVTSHFNKRDMLRHYAQHLSAMIQRS